MNSASLPTFLSFFYTLRGPCFPFLEGLDEIRSMYVLGRFPRVMGVGIPFPANQVLFCCPLFMLIEDLLHFPFLFPLDEIGGRFLKIDAIFFCLFIWVK